MCGAAEVGAFVARRSTRLRRGAATCPEIARDPPPPSSTGIESESARLARAPPRLLSGGAATCSRDSSDTFLLLARAVSPRAPSLSSFARSRALLRASNCAAEAVRFFLAKSDAEEDGRGGVASRSPRVVLVVMSTSLSAAPPSRVVTTTCFLPRAGMTSYHSRRPHLYLKLHHSSCLGRLRDDAERCAPSVCCRLYTNCCTANECFISRASMINSSEVTPGRLMR